MRPSTMGTIRSGTVRALVLLAAGALAAGCSSAGTAGTASSDSGGEASAHVEIGLVYSRSGPLAAYGTQYEQGFKAGLAYATHGTDKAGGHPIEVTEEDDAGDPAKAVAAAKALIGKGCKILAGTTDSGVALQMAPLAAQNKVLYVSGPAATDAVTGVNTYTFRSGRQTYQDIRTAGTLLGDARGKKVTVLAQNSAFGQANVAAVKAVLGQKGADVGSVLAPPSTTDLTPFARQVKAGRPDLVFVAWAGATAPALWTALDQQGVLDSSKVVTGLAGTASYPVFGAAGSKVSFLAHYFPGAGGGNPVEKAMLDGITRAGGTPDLFSPDGFTAAQMIVHAIESGSATDTSAMAKALEGWSFHGPKGREQIRAADHALLQPMFTARLKGAGAAAEPELINSIPMTAVAPPVKTAAG
ncbi:amino acid ABC transporter substrate-binding protein [Streptomyces pluripotens]|uniref:Amino acid ABC transporter substrate-binding protein n=1 Tax=Streptomyces pluripotens TaxID=1355015 RepID=A0A221NSF0_9ACTN|nr:MULTISPECIES: substrate-binding domain-containing protein [Streptomyces]ARP68603.1 amino acid ABC transporter substrate-binding protein [Streptomyces pluripotens]ASN22864.1 amino acid ABC transporter substrate-binding protein [Streptomyces pluripotens]KIE23319.1 amino acid ABC transporter substrate-binding protein [Streptomyces sp. MUSC 125]MCH0558263.1 substrate-binding domain-containing protein [Streptomyces sp. MUM 16J]